ncbi:WxL domain-containing protein [Vagococcus sp. PNs007]|uniref:WxL domain-containing protein n=1 Tax=Vagococcus proximus TaxID=2991417 RepID=A0ABT5X2H6_9ENTE|nr:WxL domain-containing protein [Vagococcus proximus]MDF0480212.1 WxL domain-containing protein [Vagococcus proximus]
MKKVSGLFLAASLLATTAVGVVSHAEENKDPFNVKTDAKVNFIQDDEGVTPPTDPEEPGKPVDPGEGGEGGTGGKGALRIDWAPSFNFGTQKIKNEGKDLVLPAIRTAEQKTAHFVQVSDLRGEDNPTWDLGVTATTLQRQAEETPAPKTDSKEITGATITFTSAPIFAVGTTATPTEAPSWSTQVMKLDQGDRQQLVTASGDGARGTWSMGMSTTPGATEKREDDKINLVIPQSEIGKIRKGSYKADLNWNLTGDVKVEDTFMSPVSK